MFSLTHNKQTVDRATFNSPKHIWVAVWTRSMFEENVDRRRRFFVFLGSVLTLETLLLNGFLRVLHLQIPKKSRLRRAE